MTYRVNVHLDTGTVFSFQVSSKDKALEWASLIVKEGYRKTSAEDLEWYPPHRIKKVKLIGTFVPPVEVTEL